MQRLEVSGAVRPLQGSLGFKGSASLKGYQEAAVIVLRTVNNVLQFVQSICLRRFTVNIPPVVCP